MKGSLRGKITADQLLLWVFYAVVVALVLYVAVS